MKLFRTIALIAMAVFFSACGGGGNSSDNPQPPPSGGITRTGSSFGPITTFGSVVVNGVRFDTTTAVITVDDSPGTQNDLRVGQVVLVNGTFNANLTTGTATAIRFDDNVEGPVQSIDLASGQLVVLGQTVSTGPATSFDDNIQPASLAGLVVGDIVEVSGLTRADGSIDATRIEKEAAGSEFEVHGTVSNLDPVNFRFSLNALVVDYSGAALDDFPGGQIANGQFVEAKGTTLNGAGQLVATRVEFEGPTIAGDADDRLEIEGFITRFASPQDFDVAGVPVTTNGSTVFAGGAAADLGLGVKVEVEGNLNASGVIVASKVDIRRATAIRATGLVDSVDRPNNRLVMLGIVVTIDSLTRLEDKSNANVRPLTINDLNAGDYVEVRGDELPAGSGQVRATLLERDDPDPDTHLQGFVTAVMQPTFTIMGVTITTNGATEFRDVDDSPISAAEFYARVAAGDLVKAKGIETSATAITADEVELED